MRPSMLNSSGWLRWVGVSSSQTSIHLDPGPTDVSIKLAGKGSEADITLLGVDCNDSEVSWAELCRVTESRTCTVL